MNEKKILSIKTIVAIGIGAAVFLVLGRFAAIPTGVPNTEIQTAYAFLALMAVLYGPVAGAAIGFIGHTLKDVTAYGMPWFSWIIASAVVGLIMGLAWKKLHVSEGVFGKKEMITFNIYQIIANLIAWGLVAPTLDIVIYAEPLDKLYLQGSVAGISNIITVGVLGTALLYAYAKTRTKKGSLDKE
ncbi:ECF transporter S component [Sporanaerobium hydrogeniformans]|uniref:ECF transporter S component n=1 Tax=Sporanaerobium hydrogeniformans TaxID=3072179 RepID=A0AC61DD02_9FIRM|nr:ECF-type riboflavin transporter substrate-binding protein [Sporanaerobium hydrogeniformans]PHV70842.1 ECF transporter S component [Sporanaerobium hydrogeniformans]